MYGTFRGQARTHTNHSLFTTLRNPTHYWCAGHTTSEKGGQNFGGGAERRNVRPPFSDWLNSTTPCQRSCSWRRAKLSVSDSHRYALVTRPPTDFIRWIVLCPKKCIVILPRRVTVIWNEDFSRVQMSVSGVTCWHNQLCTDSYCQSLFNSHGVIIPRRHFVWRVMLM